jgi:predicted nucleotidyltransferase
MVDEVRLPAVCARYGIARLMTFGSVARGTAEAQSRFILSHHLATERRK